jgi:hypothetical protein
MTGLSKNMAVPVEFYMKCPETYLTDELKKEIQSTST